METAVNQPRDWMHLERHPLSAQYRDLAGVTWQAYLACLGAHGIIGQRRIILCDGKVLDGWQLQRACVAMGIKPVYAELPSGMTAEQYVEAMNDVRRHETQEAAEQRIAARRERVAEARREGQSTRTIAEEEDVSHTTVLRDLEEATGTGVPVEPPDGKITGKDGKERPAKPELPTCERCKRDNRVGNPPVKGCSMCKELRKADAEPEETPDEPEVPCDANGLPWKDHAPKALKAIEATPALREMSRLLAGMMKQIGQNESLRLYTYSLQSVIAAMKDLKETIMGAVPSYVCPYCDGTAKIIDGAQKGKACDMCERQGWVTSYIYRRSPKGMPKGVTGK